MPTPTPNNNRRRHEAEARKRDKILDLTEELEICLTEYHCLSENVEVVQEMADDIIDRLTKLRREELV